MEHRWGARTAVHLPVELRRAGVHDERGCIEDISISGALIHTNAALAPFCRLDVVIGDERIASWVVRRMHGAVAVEWCALAPPAVIAVMRAPPAIAPRDPDRDAVAPAGLAA